ncbi:High affinity choline transporter 1 Hemicholinium-3-sensitive choline transporter [Takifugu flavidus]|uniref:High affinity choline transporter 1 Hemicholinium-3-sensitive choline transporter n=1 Tax=Takifugu flavidus TaxID=433684 RepID=A0A5C6PIH5_9TELE|nr:High affinity choline transporter 1 Hemicholinium-3-sensitive choline transporter [Takifugu flavidus]
MGVNIPGVIAIIIFYLLILGTGIWASFKSKRKQKKCAAHEMEMALLGNRSINVVVGIFTMTGVIAIAFFYLLVLGTGLWASFKSSGLEMSLLGNRSINVVVGVLTMTAGFFFAKPMRDKNFVTLLDPFHQKYGKVVAAVMSVVSVLNDILWVPIALTGLGGTMSVVLNLSFSLCVWISAAVAIIYTLLGGLYSVAYTDVVQLVLIFCSLALGGLASQCFQQRVLSSFSGTTAKISCFAAALFYLVLGIPPILLGAGAASTV